MDNLQEEQHYKKALKQIWDLMQKNPELGTAEAEQLEMLTTLVEAYEEIHYPMQPTDPISFLKYKMEVSNLKQKDLIPYIGDKTKVSKVLNRKQELTISMVQRLSKGLKIPVNLLVPA